MNALDLREFHESCQAQFRHLNGWEIVAHYGDAPAEYQALRESAAVLDLSFRSRLCLAGADRQRFLNGQVTNNVAALKTGQGCYAALVTAKGKLQSDLNVYVLEEEVLLDFEPGLSELVAARLEKYVIADDVQVVDVGSMYSLLSVQGPKAPDVLAQLELEISLPVVPWSFSSREHPTIGEFYIMKSSRTGRDGFDIFLPATAVGAVADKLFTAVQNVGGRPCGWDALELARIEAGLPRFGADMDESNLAPEAGLDSRAISYSKGCYIGQEIIARIRTYGQVAKSLRGLVLSADLDPLPEKGEKLFKGEKEAGYVTSAIFSPALGKKIALGYVRKEFKEPETELLLRREQGESPVKVVSLPF
jgi:folate-binding protein YgfZ